jgi:CheY-like chemotaxis protein
MAVLRHVMCVEDEADIRLIVQTALETVAGLRVTLCDDGARAVAAARDARPDLIALDVMMPGTDGPAVLRALRADPLTAAIPIVFITAKVQPDEVSHLLRQGAIGVVAKPFDPMTLAAQLSALWQSVQNEDAHHPANDQSPKNN